MKTEEYTGCIITLGCAGILIEFIIAVLVIQALLKYINT